MSTAANTCLTFLIVILCSSGERKFAGPIVRNSNKFVWIYSIFFKFVPIRSVHSLLMNSWVQHINFIFYFILHLVFKFPFSVKGSIESMQSLNLINGHFEWKLSEASRLVASNRPEKLQNSLRALIDYCWNSGKFLLCFVILFVFINFQGCWCRCSKWVETQFFELFSMFCFAFESFAGCWRRLSMRHKTQFKYVFTAWRTQYNYIWAFIKCIRGQKSPFLLFPVDLVNFDSILGLWLSIT